MREIDRKLTRIAPPVLLIAALIAVWWIVVANSDNPIFPTPGEVATATWALARTDRRGVRGSRIGWRNRARLGAGGTVLGTEIS